MPHCPRGDQWQVEPLRSWGRNCSTSLSATLPVGPSTPSAHSLTTPRCMQWCHPGNLHMLERWANANLMKFNKVLGPTPGSQQSQAHPQGWAKKWLRAAQCRRTWGDGWWKLNMSHQCVFTAQKANSGLHQKENGQQAKAGDSPPLPCSGCNSYWNHDRSTGLGGGTTAYMIAKAQYTIKQCYQYATTLN